MKGEFLPNSCMFQVAETMALMCTSFFLYDIV